MGVVAVAVGAQDRVLLGNLCAMRQDISDLRSRYVRRDGIKRATDFLGRIGLEVPHIDVAWSTFKHEEDASFGLGRSLGRRRRLQFQQCRQRQSSKKSSAANPQRPTASDAVTMPVFGEGKVEHVEPFSF